MRCDQYMGLPPSAKTWIDSDCRMVCVVVETTRIYFGGHKEKTRHEYQEPESVPYQKFSGMFGDEYSLHEYVKLDGSKVREFVQSDEWSSGPCFYIGLTDETGKQLFVWQRCEKCFEFHDGDHDPELCAKGVHE